MIDVFISYSYNKNHSSGFGNVSYALKSLPSSLDDVKAIARDIEELQGFDKNSCVILNWIVLKEETENVKN